MAARPPIEWRKKSTVLVVVITALGVGAGVIRLHYVGGTAAVLSSALAAVVVIPIFLQLPQIASRLKALAGRLRWWHLAWSLVFASGLVFRVRDIQSIYSNPSDIWAIFRVGLMAAVMLILLGQLLVRNFNWLPNLFRGSIGLLASFSLISILSTSWSVYPAWTLYRSAEYLVDVWLAAAVITAVRQPEDLKALFDWAWMLVLLLLASVWVGLLWSPQQAIIQGVGILGPQIRGVVPVVASNGVGELGALLAVMALTRLLSPTPLRRTYFCLFVAGAGTLLLSQSRSPLVGFLLAVPLILFAARRIEVGLLLVLLLPAALSVTSLGDLLWRLFMRGQSQELFVSLSGRMDWWRFSLPVFLERPCWGYGAYAGGRFVVLAALDITLSSSIHNTWLEVLLGTGLLGLLPLLASFAWAWLLLIRPRTVRPWNAPDQRLHAEAIGIFTVLSVRSMFTATLIWHPPLMFLLVMVYAERLRRDRQTAQPSAQPADPPAVRARKRSPPSRPAD